jgi:hypothetical protein
MANCGDNLINRLRIREVSPEEFRIVVGRGFPEGSHDGGDTVVYLRDHEPALSIVYDKHGVVTELHPGPALTDDDIAKLEAEMQNLLADNGQAVRRAVCFCAIPVTISWRYRDDFQIVPMPADAPRPPALVGYHPFTLEVKFCDSPNHLIAGERHRRKLREINLLLAAFLPLVSDRSPFEGSQDWVSLMGTDDEPFGASGWGQLGYRGAPTDGPQHDFSNPIGSHAALIADDEFYNRRGISFESVFDLPASFPTLLDRYYASGNSRRNRVMRWAFWLNHAGLVWRLSQSATYMAATQAIEALRPQVSEGERCDSCNHVLGAGPTQQFINFVNRYMPRQDDKTEKGRRTLYSVRSALTHGGTLLDSDRDLGIGFGSFHPTPIQQREATGRVLRLARLVGVNWLLEDG